MTRQKTIHVLSLALDVALAVVFLFIVANAFNTSLVYRRGFGLLERVFEVFSYLIIARIAIVIPVRRLLATPPMHRLFLACSAIMFVLFLHVLININFYSAVRAIIITRISFDDATDLEIATDITEDNLWYPQASLVQRMKDQIAEGDGIAYIGDQRAHIISYLLYPRRVYALPEMQIVLNEMVEENWTWSPLIDPFHPPKDPMNPVFEGYPQNEPNREIQDKFRRMVAEKDIRWVLYYDSTHPAKSWFRRIEGS